MEIRLLNTLRQLTTPAFRLRHFEPIPMEFEPDELLLDEVVVAYESDSRVVPIFAGTAPGELRARIERHMRAQSTQQEPQRSASEELAEALAELRRSLR